MELAFQYYRECISMTNKSNDHQNYVICTNNHNSFKAEAKEWIGTTGKLAPWTCGNSSGKNDTGSNDNHGGIPGSVNMIHCFVCKKETQLLSCTGCSALTKYCSRVCQTKDWSRHKLICFGCKREGNKWRKEETKRFEWWKKESLRWGIKTRKEINNRQTSTRSSNWSVWEVG